jgi:methionyl aminopeptidase
MTKAIRIHDKDSVQGMYEAGRIACLALDLAEQYIKNNSNITTLQLDKICHDFIVSQGGTPECIGYMGYKHATCTSQNDIACHGVPGDYVLKDGDIVNLDLVVRYNDWLGDTSRTFGIGNISSDNAKLIEIARNAMYEGMKVVRNQIEFRYIGYAIEKFCSKQNVGGKNITVLSSYCGHGISKEMHQGPLVEHIRNSSTILIKPYLYFTIEPIIVVGNDERTYTEDDQWTVRTRSGENCAQFEHTMGIDEKGKLMIFTTRDKAHEEEILNTIYS